jgi:hypothetical protein
MVIATSYEMNRNNFRIVYFLFFFLIITLPFNTYKETIAFFYGAVGDKTRALTPLYFKLYKDIFLFCALFLVVLGGGLIRIYQRLLGFYVLLVFIFIYAALSLIQLDVLTVFLGLRSYLPIIFILFGFYFYRFDPATLFPVLRVLLYLEFVLQILQLLYAPSYYGSALLGYNLTNPGTFLIPSTMASFAILVYYYARERGDPVTAVFALMSVVMSRSSTALIVLIIYFVIMLIKRSRFSDGVLVVILLLSAYLLYSNIELVTGRDNIADNLVIRFGIFLENLSEPLGQGFGLGSGAAVLTQREGAQIADSTITSLLINFGWFSFGIYFIFVAKSFQTFGYKNLLCLAFVGFSLTMIIFEMTPFIQFYFFELGRAMRKNDELATGST